MINNILILINKAISVLIYFFINVNYREKNYKKDHNKIKKNLLLRVLYFNRFLRQMFKIKHILT